MNQKIKFRAWDTVKKEMRYEQMWWNDSWVEFITEREDPYPVQRFIFMQYIRLKDKNEKEIWEGDIVDIILPSTALEQTRLIKRGIIEYDESYCAFVVKIYKNYSDYREGRLWDYEHIHDDIELIVVGNIYENPELLNDGIKLLEEDNNDT